MHNPTTSVYRSFDRIANIAAQIGVSYRHVRDLPEVELDALNAEYETWEAHSRDQAALYASGNYRAACQADLCAEASLCAMRAHVDNDGSASVTIHENSGDW